MGDGTPKNPNLAIGPFVKSLAYGVCWLLLGQKFLRLPGLLCISFCDPFFHFSLSHYFFLFSISLILRLNSFTMYQNNQWTFNRFWKIQKRNNQPFAFKNDMFYCEWLEKYWKALRINNISNTPGSWLRIDKLNIFFIVVRTLNMSTHLTNL